MESQTVTSCTPCAEFPNDNPALHGGAIWRCRGVTGAAEWEPPTAQVARILLEPEPTLLAEPVADPPVVAVDVVDEALAAVETAVAAEASTDPTPPVLMAEDDEDEIEIVDELAFEDVVDESPAPEAVIAPEAEDPFVALTAVLESVARGAGAGEAAIATLRIVLGRERVTADISDELLVLREQAAAWQGILRGDSEDFGACGAPSLDEWSALTVARVMGEIGRADGLRRELRRRGVAAFGLVIEAA